MQMIIIDTILQLGSEPVMTLIVSIWMSLVARGSKTSLVL